MNTLSYKTISVNKETAKISWTIRGSDAIPAKINHSCQESSVVLKAFAKKSNSVTANWRANPKMKETNNIQKFGRVRRKRTY